VWGGPSPATSTDQVYMSTLSFLLDPSNPWRRRHYVASKHQETLVQGHGVTSQ
jgi:hypothetical protein